MSSPTPAPTVWLRPLGGVGRFGRNCLALEVDEGPALVVDCGVRFLHDTEAPGFELALPDLDAIEALGARLVAYVITHGHEDHIGALPYAYERAPAPIYATAYTRSLIERRFRRCRRRCPDIELLHYGAPTDLQPFTVTPYAVSHSVPDTAALAIDTPAGTIVHSADFRVDDAPLFGPPTDLEGLRAVGDRGVRCLVADSTGALAPGRNPGERSVVGPLTAAMRDAPGRVVVSTYSSHVQRVGAVAEACRATGRRLVVLGRSLKENLHNARVVGLFSADDVLLGEGDLESVPPSKLAVVCPGCQGEEASTLARVARGEHRSLRLSPGDRVILASRTIPGNEIAVASLLDALALRGVETLGGREGRHVSGHGHREDLELLLAAVRPEVFVAAHGGHRMLAHHRRIAGALGVDEDALIPLEDGARLGLAPDDALVHEPRAPAAEPLVEGGEVVLRPEPVLAARRRMAVGGALLVDLTALTLTGHGTEHRLSGPALRELTGFVRARVADGVEAAELVDRIARRIAADGIAVPHIIVVGEPTGAPATTCQDEA